MDEGTKVKPAVKMRPRRERSTDLPPGMTITHEYGDDPNLLANTLRWLLKQPIAAPADTEGQRRASD